MTSGIQTYEDGSRHSTTSTCGVRIAEVHVGSESEVRCRVECPPKHTLSQFEGYPTLELVQTPKMMIQAVLGATWSGDDPGIPEKGIWDITCPIVYPGVPVSLFMRSSRGGAVQVNRVLLSWGTRPNQWERLLSSYL